MCNKMLLSALYWYLHTSNITSFILGLHEQHKSISVMVAHQRVNPNKTV